MLFKDRKTLNKTKTCYSWFLKSKQQGLFIYISHLFFSYNSFEDNNFQLKIVYNNLESCMEL